MKLYHVTDIAGADTVVRDGFRDEEGSFGIASIWLLGVFVSDEPLTVYETPDADHLIEVVLPDGTTLEHELPEDGKGYREWCLPAQLLNQWPRRRLDMADVEALETEQVGRPGRSADLLASLVQTRGNPFGKEEERNANDRQLQLVHQPDALAAGSDRLN